MHGFSSINHFRLFNIPSHLPNILDSKNINITFFHNPFIYNNNVSFFNNLRLSEKT